MTGWDRMNGMVFGRRVRRDDGMGQDGQDVFGGKDF